MDTGLDAIVEKSIPTSKREYCFYCSIYKERRRDVREADYRVLAGLESPNKTTSKRKYFSICHACVLDHDIKKLVEIRFPFDSYISECAKAIGVPNRDPHPQGWSRHVSDSEPERDWHWDDKG